MSRLPEFSSAMQSAWLLDNRIFKQRNVDIAVVSKRGCDRMGLLAAQ